MVCFGAELLMNIAKRVVVENNAKDMNLKTESLECVSTSVTLFILTGKRLCLRSNRRLALTKENEIRKQNFKLRTRDKMETKTSNTGQTEYLQQFNVVRCAKWGLRKIKDAEKPCLSPEHNPPTHIVLSAGTYEYTCPSCGKVMVFTVPLITY